MKTVTTWKRTMPRWVLPLLAMLLIGSQARSEDSPVALSANESELLQEEPVKTNIHAPQQSAPVVFDGIGVGEVLEMAIQSNPDLQVLKANVKASQMRWLAEGLLPNPEVTGGAKKVSGGSSGPVVEITQEIPINGVIQMERESARLGYRAEEARSLREAQKILYEVQIQAAEVLSAKAAQEVEKENLRITTDSFELVSNRFESGLIAELPLSLARAEKGAAVNGTELAAREVNIQREKLAILLGLTASVLPPIGGSIESSFLPEDFFDPGTARDDLRAKDLEVQSAQADVEAARRSRIPNPVLGYSREEAGSDTENFFTLGLQIPIWNSGRPEVEKKHAEYEVSRKERESLRQSIEFERNLAEKELKQRNEAVLRYESEILPAIHDSLVSAGASFKSGKTDLSLLLQTQARLVGIKREALGAKKALRLAELNYLFALGLPSTPTKGN